MITPSFGLTATERVLPRLALDWTTGLTQSGVDVTRAGAATFVGSNGLIQSATADTQRIDYATGTAGLLVEESRTNINTYSAGSFVSGSNGYINSGTLVTTVAGIDGTVNAEQFTYDGGIQQNFYKTIAVSASTAYAFSFYYQLGTLPESAVVVAFRDDTNGVFITTAATLTKTPLSNGWVRAVCTVTTPVGCLLLRCYVLRSVPASTGTIAFDGMQLEAGAFPTSYIPTSSSAVTRNADLPAMTGTNFSDWFNASEGTFYCDVSPIKFGGATTFEGVVSANDGTANNVVALSGLGGPTTRNHLYGQVRTSNVQQVALPLKVNVGSARTTAAFTYKLNDFAGAANGTNLQTSTSGTVPTVDRLSIMSENPNGRWLNGHIHKIAYWPHRVTNSEVIAFSKG